MTKKILVVDDDEGFRAMSTAVLEQAGFDVVSARDGGEAWDLLSSQPFDAMVVDLNMPVMDGLELTKKIRGDARLKNFPILMLTVRELVIDQLAGYDRGADDYMTKPFDARMLVARTNALLRRGEDPDSTRP